MSLSHEQVAHVAHLARLSLTEAELSEYQGQLSAILAYADMLNELDLADIPPTSHAVAQTNVMREDVARPCLPTEKALQNAAKKADNQFLIQNVLDE